MSMEAAGSVEEREDSEAQRRINSLINKDTSRAFADVSEALHLNLSDLYIEESSHKLLLAENFNRWLKCPEDKGNFVLQNKALQDIPVFIQGLHFDCHTLDLQWNSISSLKEELRSMEKLRVLNLSHNCLRDIGDDALEDVVTLQRLSLGDNQLSSIPPAICKLSHLEWLDIQDNALDHLPDELVSLSSLSLLNARHNDIAYLPMQIGDMKSLTALLLDGNILLDPLPSSFALLCNLRCVSLQSTGLATFPSSLCDLRQLEHLNIAHNSISSLPSEMANMVYLQHLDISYNQIRALPDTFGWLISLNELNWEGGLNALGNVPKEKQGTVASIRLHFRNIIRKNPQERVALFEEIECKNNIRWKDVEGESDEENLILGGTVEKLVQLLTHETFIWLNYSRCFLFLHQSFCTSSELLELLILRYRSFDAEEEGTTSQEGSTTPRTAYQRKIVPIRTLNTITKWMTTHPQHFTRNISLIQELSRFIDSLPVDTQNEKLRKAFNRLTDGAGGQKNSHASIGARKKEPPPKPILPDSFPGCVQVTAIDPKEIARQACLMEYELLSQVQAQEFLNQNWTRSNKEEVAPNLTRYIKYFNRFSGFVTSTVLKHKDTKQRVQIISLFITVAEECRKLNNFNTVIEVVAALNSTAIHRLKISWKLVPSKLKNTWTKLLELTSIENNNRNYRKALDEAVRGARIPNLGVIMKDLTFSSDGNSDFIDNNEELINFQKLRTFEQIIERIQHYQREPYNFEKVPEIQNVLVNGDVWDEQKAYAESLICEDREGRTAAMRGEVVEYHNDTIINLDINLTDDQKTAAEKNRSEWFETHNQLGLSGSTETKTGYLMLRENSVWRRLWFSLQYPSLYYYDKHTDKRPTGVIKLLDVEVEKIGKKKNFAILISHKKYKPHAIRGDNDQISLEWYKELCKHLNIHE